MSLLPFWEMETILFFKCITCTQFFLLSIALYNFVPSLLFFKFQNALFFLVTVFLLPSLCYKIAAPRKRFRVASSGFFFTPIGNGPSNDGFCRAGAKTPSCILELQPLCTSHEGVRECYGVCEAGRVTVASAAWTRGCEDCRGAQMACFISPSHSPLLHWEEQSTFLWEGSSLQEHQSSL